MVAGLPYIVYMEREHVPKPEVLSDIRETEAAIAVGHQTLKRRREMVELLEQQLRRAKDKLSKIEQRLSMLEEELHRLRMEGAGEGR